MTLLAVCVTLLWSAHVVGRLRLTPGTPAARGGLGFRAAAEGDASVCVPLAEPVLAPDAERARGPTGPLATSPYGR